MNRISETVFSEPELLTNYYYETRKENKSPQQNAQSSCSVDVQYGGFADNAQAY
jgi:hypothetical protein